jgi:hypothetical protein
MSENLPLNADLVHRLRRPGRPIGTDRADRVNWSGRSDWPGETVHPPGRLAVRSVRFAGALTPRSLPQARPVNAGSLPGRTLAAAVRTEVPVHRLAPVQAAGVMVVPRDLLPLRPQA